LQFWTIVRGWRQRVLLVHYTQAERKWISIATDELLAALRFHGERMWLTHAC